MTAQQAFDQLTAAIDNDVAKKNYLGSVEKAGELGLVGGEKEHPTNLATYYFAGSFEDGDVIFEIESYDSSKTFKAQPDVTRFAVELKQEGKSKGRHTNAYED